MFVCSFNQQPHIKLKGYRTIHGEGCIHTNLSFWISPYMWTRSTEHEGRQEVQWSEDMILRSGALSMACLCHVCSICFVLTLPRAWLVCPFIPSNIFKTLRVISELGRTLNGYDMRSQHYDIFLPSQRRGFFRILKFHKLKRIECQ